MSWPTRSRIRIIPALAGNTPAGGSGCGVRQDHPRSRGEYRHGGVVIPCGHGSSPLSRGILFQSGSTDTAAGIIPALAGNTCGRLKRPMA